jgi:hypothetical protein
VGEFWNFLGGYAAIPWDPPCDFVKLSSEHKATIYQIIN